MPINKNAPHIKTLAKSILASIKTAGVTPDTLPETVLARLGIFVDVGAADQINVDDARALSDVMSGDISILFDNANLNQTAGTITIPNITAQMISSSHIFDCFRDVLITRETDQYTLGGFIAVLLATRSQTRSQSNRTIIDTITKYLIDNYLTGGYKQFATALTRNALHDVMTLISKQGEIQILAVAGDIIWVDDSHDINPSTIIDRIAKDLGLISQYGTVDFIDAPWVSNHK